jgi:hypothetical protein
MPDLIADDARLNSDSVFKDQTALYQNKSLVRVFLFVFTIQPASRVGKTRATKKNVTHQRKDFLTTTHPVEDT